MTLPLETSQEVLTSPGPFEGPEKLLEIWFAPSFDQLPNSQHFIKKTSFEFRNSIEIENNNNNNDDDDDESMNRNKNRNNVELKGLRKIPKYIWEEMLDIVKCKVLSVVEGNELDAYLLSESSLFVAPHLVILKTCGTTLNLLGLYRIIEIAKEWCGFTNVWRCFYSRKSFFFPERQQGPHKDWTDEVKFLDTVFGTAGAAYTVGPMNRDHWLLYLTSPNTVPNLPNSTLPSPASSLILPSPSQELSNNAIASSSSYSSQSIIPTKYQDTTLEILMTHLSPNARSKFYNDNIINGGGGETGTVKSGLELGYEISNELGINKLFSKEETILDSFGFDPCGYSANAVIGSGLPESDNSGRGGGYFTIHVTPEEGWSYASFECNVPLPTCSDDNNNLIKRPELKELIKKVVNIFEPSRLSITLFVSTNQSNKNDNNNNIELEQQQEEEEEEEEKETEIEQKAWQSFGTDLLGKSFIRKDRIGYEFDGYDLVFACFEKRGWKEPFSEISIGQRNGDV